ncbi:MAG: hypothetical protein HQ465_18480 [Rhodospirillales bacterium]|nr:hypothetical protein [Rhodospirillales bacterium]
MRSIPAVTAAAMLFAGLSLPAVASDRPVTDQERTRLEEAVKTAGWTGGKMEFDDD